jgi:uncharacterized protein (TIGR00369 family)
MRDDSGHYRKLERMYHAAPTNAYYRPRLTIGHGEAELEIAVRPEFFHAAAAVHGSVYFKALDDASFFAVNSLVTDVFVLTVSYNIYLTRPVSSGVLRAKAKLVHRSRQLFLADGELFDGEGRQIARGSGSFMRSSIALTPDIGYV